MMAINKVNAEELNPMGVKATAIRMSTTTAPAKVPVPEDSQDPRRTKAGGGGQ